jgi:hypothetical protein
LAKVASVSAWATVIAANIANAITSGFVTATTGDGASGVTTAIAIRFGAAIAAFQSAAATDGEQNGPSGAILVSVYRNGDVTAFRRRFRSSGMMQHGITMGELKPPSQKRRRFLQHVRA